MMKWDIRLRGKKVEYKLKYRDTRFLPDSNKINLVIPAMCAWLYHKIQHKMWGSLCALSEMSVVRFSTCKLQLLYCGILKKTRRRVQELSGLSTALNVPVFRKVNYVRPN